MGSTPIRMGAPKDSMEPRKVLPAGRYTVRLDGFKPAMSKNKDNPSVNFFPQLKITNHATLNGEKVFTPLNQSVGFILQAFCHMFGQDLELQGDAMCIPGGFNPDPTVPDDISKMTYAGPLQGATGDLELGVQKQTMGRNVGKDQNYIKQFYCRLPGCTEKHPTELS